MATRSGPNLARSLRMFSVNREMPTQETLSGHLRRALRPTPASFVSASLSSASFAFPSRRSAWPRRSPCSRGPLRPVEKTKSQSRALIDDDSASGDSGTSCARSAFIRPRGKIQSACFRSNSARSWRPHSVLRWRGRSMRLKAAAERANLAAGFPDRPDFDIGENAVALGLFCWPLHVGEGRRCAPQCPGQPPNANVFR